MNELDPSDQRKLLVMILKKGLDNEEFLSSICDTHDCSQDQLKMMLKSVVYDYLEQLNELD